MLVEDSGAALPQGGSYHAGSDEITQQNPDKKAVEGTLQATWTGSPTKPPTTQQSAYGFY